MHPSSDTAQHFRASGIESVGAQLESEGAWVVVTSSDDAVTTLSDTGRARQRILLGMRVRTIAVHPMTQAFEESRVRVQLLPQLGISGAAHFILRAGYLAACPEPVSLRVPLLSSVTGAPVA